MPNLRIVTALIAVVPLVACSTLRRPGFPRQSYDEEGQIKQLEAAFERPQMIEDYYDPAKTPEMGKRDARDRIITGRIVLIDLNYNQFVSQFSFHKQTLDAVTDITTVGLNLATTAVGGEGAKTVLGAAAAGITSSKIAIDKDMFYEKTVPVLVTAMNAERKRVLVSIMKGLAQPADQYTLAQGLSDLDSYYFAGTFLGALQSIQADAGAKEARAEIQLTTVRERGFFEKERQDRVGKLVDQIDGLLDAQALGLEAKPPLRDQEIDKVVASRDPTGQRFKRGSAAREMLKMRIILSKRSDADLDAWEAALQAVK